MSRTNFIEEFKRVDTSRLDKNELEVLYKLIEAAKLVEQVYKKQLDSQNHFSVYPSDATRAEIEKAASHNKDILSPYTVVERDQKGRLIAVPYHIKYRAGLLSISRKLQEAAHLSRNKQFAHALNIQASALLNGEYDKAQVIWMKIKPYILDVTIGPFERIEDNLFFTKRAYQSWVGIMNKSFTERTIKFRNTVFTARHKLESSAEKIDFIDKAQIRVDDVVIFAGMIAKFHYTGITLPNDLDILEKYGSETTIFIPMVRESFSRKHYPISKTIFAPHFRQSFLESDLHRGYLDLVMMHEIMRVLIRYKFATSRLKELYPIFNELTLESLAVKYCGTLLLKDAISQKEMESILVMFLTRIFDYYFEMKDDPGIKPYVLGNAIMLNSLVFSGALKISKDGISWPNFTKMFIAVSNLADEMEKLLAEGTYADASHYLKGHSSLDVFKRFRGVFDKKGMRK